MHSEYNRDSCTTCRHGYRFNLVSFGEKGDKANCLHVTLKRKSDASERERGKKSGNCISFLLITTRVNGVVRLLSVIIQDSAGQIDLSPVSKIIAIASPASIVSFISFCHFRRFPITHYRLPFASTLLFYFAVIPNEREGGRERLLEKNVISVFRGVPIYLLGCGTSSKHR